MVIKRHIRTMPGVERVANEMDVYIVLEYILLNLTFIRINIYIITL